MNASQATATSNTLSATQSYGPMSTTKYTESYGPLSTVKYTAKVSKPTVPLKIIGEEPPPTPKYLLTRQHGQLSLSKQQATVVPTAYDISTNMSCNDDESIESKRTYVVLREVVSRELMIALAIPVTVTAIAWLMRPTASHTATDVDVPTNDTLASSLARLQLAALSFLAPTWTIASIGEATTLPKPGLRKH